MEKKNYRHGDVLIIPRTKARPAGGVKRKEPVLAYGEVTGHSHRMTEGRVELHQYDEKMHLRVLSKIGALTHEEHSRIDLPKGDYDVEIQRDYVPGGWTKVID